MANVKIFTDSCSDLTKELREKYDIEYVLMNVVRDGKEYPASLDWESFSVKEFYGFMRNGERITTTAVPMSEFEKKFTPWLEQGYDIVYIGCSSKLSGSVEMGVTASKVLKEKYPDQKIICLNSQNSCVGEGMLTIKAAEFRDEGLDAETIAQKVSELRNYINQYCTVNTLDYLRRAGRVKPAKAFIGNLLGMKPIIISNVEGENASLKKSKGRVNSMNDIVDLTVNNIVDPENQTVFICHSDSEEDAAELKRLLLDKIPTLKTYTCYIGPIIGASVGPDAIAIFSFGKSVEQYNV